jgi:choline dehydrogenase-like flavoprotein
MIINSRHHEINTDVYYDICIIGAGAAGITAALELAGDSSLNLVILEAGGEHFAHEAQSLFQGEVEGDRHPPLWRARFSGLGGSTQIWAGWCRPLEDRDFDRRDYVAGSGWPIKSDELRSAYRRANEICGLGAYDYELETWKDLLTGKPLSSAPELLHHIFQIRKLRFNQNYYADLHTAKNVHLYLYSPVMRLHAKQDGRRVDCVEIASYNGKKTRLRAKQFIIATGGIENARLLLLSGSSPENALGNQNDCVGRYFIDHGFIDSGWFIPGSDTRDLRYYFPVSHPQDFGHASFRPVITLSPVVLEKEKMLNAAMYFYPSYESHPVFASVAVKAALELWEIVKDKKLSELIEISKADAALGDLRNFGKRICSRPHYILQALLRKAVIKDTSCSRWRTRFYYECVPSADNRVSLSEEKDQFGRRRSQLNWYLSDQDLDSAYRFHVYLNNVLQKTGAGQLIFFDNLLEWRSNTETGKHPSGTTRMHDDPKQGVVDKNCRVHGLENLYIAGSSIFPTAGYANPTLTIVALAVRLAEHLQRQRAKIRSS